MRRALVVGVSTYADTGIDPLPGARRDAFAIAEALSGENFGFTTTILLDEDATRANVLQSLHAIRSEDPADLLFYFSGHGAQSDGGTSVVLHDAEDFDLGISLDELVGRRLNFASTNVTMILDCCHSGGVRIKGNEIRAPRRSDIERGMYAADGNLSAIAGCLADEFSYDDPDLGHGLLTYSILQGFKGLAADDSGRITPTSLYTYTAAVLDEKAQTPCFRGALDQHCVIGEGFDHRPPHTASVDEIVALAQQAEDEYGHFVRNRSMLSDITARRERGFLQDCRLLEEKIRWSQRVSTAHPELLGAERFIGVVQEFQNERALLCNLSVGTKIPGGTIEKKLGSGGFGSVWLVARDSGHQAFKVYHSNELDDHDKIGRFQTGYRANQQLSHPNIVEVFEERLVPFGFYMEAIDGPNLRDAGAASWEAGPQLRFLITAAETIQFAHDKGVIHRDLKPENILVRWNFVSDEYEPVVSDFDLAWFSTATQRTQAAMGMALYAPPEQRDFVNQDAVRRQTVDIFAFAQVMFYVLTGRDPQVNQTEKNKHVLQSALTDKLPAVAIAELIQLYSDCSAYDPDQRPQSFDTLINILREARIKFDHARDDTPLSVSAFLEELSPQVSGTLLLQAPSSSDYVLQSRTGRTEVSLVRTHDQGERCGFEFRFRPVGQFGIAGTSNAELRKLANQQLDRALTHATVPAYRRSGQQGVYEVFVDIPPVALRTNEVPAVADVCLRAIRVLESVGG